MKKGNASKQSYKTSWINNCSTEEMQKEESDKILRSETSFVDISNEAKYAESSKSDSERAKNVGGTGTSLFSDTPEMVQSSIHKRCHIF